jgi:hypothetical protein
MLILVTLLYTPAKHCSHSYTFSPQGFSASRMLQSVAVIDGAYKLSLSVANITIPFSAANGGIGFGVSSTTSVNFSYPATLALASTDATLVQAGVGRDAKSLLGTYAGLNGMASITTTPLQAASAGLLTVQSAGSVLSASSVFGAASSSIGQAAPLAPVRMYLQMGDVTMPANGRFSAVLTSLTVTNYKLAALYGKNLAFAPRPNGQVCAYISAAQPPAPQALKLIFAFNFPIEYITAALGGLKPVGALIVKDLVAITGVPDNRFFVSSAYSNTVVDVQIRPAGPKDVAVSAVGTDQTPQMIVSTVMASFPYKAASFQFLTRATKVDNAPIMLCQDGTYADICANTYVSSKPAMIAIIVLIVVVIGTVLGYWMGVKYLRMRKAAELAEMRAHADTINSGEHSRVF